jgi:hypothetical protein
LTHFNFSVYNYDNSHFESFDEYVIITCKSATGVNNDTLLLCNIADETVDICGYEASSVAKSAGRLYIGSSVTESTYEIFTGFDDEGTNITNSWTSKDESYGSDYLKKIRKLRFKGLIDANQSFEVYVNYDNSGDTLVGTILGSGDYVDYSGGNVVGQNVIGTSQIGGDSGSIAYPYFAEIKLNKTKFRKRSITVKAKGIGYLDIDMIQDFDIKRFENKIPKRYRQKQNVGLDGITI